jgi:hypothetical protein
MGLVWLYPWYNHLAPIELEELLSVASEKTRGQNNLWRIIILLVIQTINTSEIRDSAFSRYTRSTKENGTFALFD